MLNRTEATSRKLRQQPPEATATAPVLDSTHRHGKRRVKSAKISNRLISEIDFRIARHPFTTHRQITGQSTIAPRK
jgi:hypothetical protein